MEEAYTGRSEEMLDCVVTNAENQPVSSIHSYQEILLYKCLGASAH